MLTKKLAKKIVDDLPSKADWEELQYRIFVMAKIDRSRESIKDGLVSQDEMEKEFCGK
jgi:hypothetical protein